MRLHISRSKLLITITLLVFSIHTVYGKMTPQNYVDKYSDLAVKEMKRSGVPASITLAQGMLESNYGNSTLAVKANNHFGIKCHNDWKGKTMHRDDDMPNECFRKYNSVFDSYKDHSNFLREKNRYKDLFDLKTTNYKGWAYGLKKAGYATDPHYPKRLIKLIEDYELYKFDRDINTKDILTNDDFTVGSSRKNVDGFVIDMDQQHQVGYNNGIRYVEVKDGDTFENLSEEFGMRPWEIYTYNDLSSDASIDSFRYLYIQPKRNKAHKKHPVHVVKEGETMHYISQKYGVKINRLYKYNNMEKGDEPKVGTKINLRKKSN